MKVLISGSSGMVGSALVPALEAAGHRVVRLVRDEPALPGTAVTWDPTAGRLDPASLSGMEAVVNLNGSNIGEGRWTERRKQELRSSRLRPTELLVKTIGRLEPPPRVFVNASAVGYYGDRGDEVLDESAGPGEGFLADLTRDWEATAAAAAGHTRVVLLRLGMVVGRGGALGRMLPAFRLGLGGPIGSGRQWWPWIGLDDVVAVVARALTDVSLQGPLNLVAPHEVRCREFTSSLGRVLQRPAVMPLPALAARLALGEMAESVLLASARVRPAALLDAGFAFAFPLLEPALRHAL